MVVNPFKHMIKRAYCVQYYFKHINGNFLKNALQNELLKLKDVTYENFIHGHFNFILMSVLVRLWKPNFLYGKT
jgi:hypothetical protein